MPLVVEAGDKIDKVLPHHGLRGLVDQAKVKDAIERIGSDKVMFAGQYHETRRKSFRNHLIEHIKDA